MLLCDGILYAGVAFIFFFLFGGITYRFVLPERYQNVALIALVIVSIPIGFAFLPLPLWFNSCEAAAGGLAGGVGGIAGAIIGIVVAAILPAGTTGKRWGLAKTLGILGLAIAFIAEKGSSGLIGKGIETVLTPLSQNVTRTLRHTTNTQFDQGITSRVTSLEAAKKTYPKEYARYIAKLAEFAREAEREGVARSRIPQAVQTKMSTYSSQLLPHASNEIALELLRSRVRLFQKIYSADPAACLTLGRGNAATMALIANSLTGDDKLMTATVRLIGGDHSSEAMVMSRKDYGAILKFVYEWISTESKEEADLYFGKAAPTGANAHLYCSAQIRALRAVSALPESVQIFRTMEFVAQGGKLK